MVKVKGLAPAAAVKLEGTEVTVVGQMDREHEGGQQQVF